MPDPAQLAPPRTSGSFADLFASFTGKVRNDDWDDSALADDVTSITYEQALHASLPPRLPEHATKSLHDHNLQPVPVSTAQEPISLSLPGEKKSRTASITVRVTAEEQARLHERAASAQLSVSAYLRSCIFEAESLRSQVKEALSQIRADVGSEHPGETPHPKPASTWRARLLPLWRHHRASA